MADPNQSEGRNDNDAIPASEAQARAGRTGKVAGEHESFKKDGAIPGANDLEGPAGEGFALYLQDMAQTCGHDHDDDAGLSGALLADELDIAERRVGEAGERLTPPRRRVLELLFESGQPVKAYDLMAAYQPGAPAKPPTVYRALEFLERQGLVHRIQSLNAYVACRRGEVHTAAFLICDCCGATSEVEPAAAKAMAEQATKAGFALRAVTVEANGLCAACQRDAA